MKLFRIFNISLTIMALLTLLTINPASAEVAKKGDTTSTETAVSMQKININQADAKTLAVLKGVGKDRAAKIIEFREQNGPFEKIEDIMKVKGIGKKIYKQNKDVLTI